MFKTPTIIVNYKTYSQSVGEKGLELTKLIEKESTVNWAICPQTTDIRLNRNNTNLPIFAQHVDPIRPGSNTGHTLLQSLKKAGIDGTLINHSEKQIKLSDIEKIVDMCKKENLTTIVCANNPEVASAAAALSPDFVAYEPPELIGGDISVSSAKPQVVKEAVKRVKSVNKKVEVLCGAGVKNGEDVLKAIELGTKGVLLASGLVKSSDPKKVIIDLESGLK